MRHNPLLLTLNGQFYPPYNIVFLFQVILNSMHKFQPRIYLVKRSEGVNGPVTDIEKEKYRDRENRYAKSDPVSFIEETNTF